MVYIIFLISLAAVSKGADWLVDGAAGITKSLGISQVIVGATVVSLGTTLPEALISSFAAYQGRSGVIAGTALKGHSVQYSGDPRPIGTHQARRHLITGHPV